MCQYQFHCNPFFQPVKGLLFFGSPLPFLVFSCEFVQWSSNKCKVFDEWAIKIEESERFSYVCYILRYWPCVNASNFCRFHACHPLFKDYPQVIHGRRVKETFLRFEVEVVELCHFEDVMNSAMVVVEVGAGGNANIIHVHPNCRSKRFVFEDDIPIDVVHHGLKRRGRVGESKVHDRRFKESVSGFKRCFPLVSLLDAYIVVSPSYIKFGVDVCVTQVANEVCNERERVLIANREGVDFPIVLYWS